MNVNSILSQHFDWNKKAQEFGFIAVPKSVFMSLIEGLDDEKLARIGKEVIPATWKEMAEFWLQDSSPDAILYRLLARFKSSPYSRTKVTKEGDTYTIVMSHDFGPKWSIASKSALQEFVRQSFHVEPRISQGDSVVTARFKVNPRDLPS